MSLVGQAESVALGVVPGGGWFRLALKLAPFILIALLVGYVLWQRGTVNKLSGERDLAVTQANALGDIVIADNKTITSLSQRQIDNDAIANAVAKRLDSNRARTEGQRQDIRNATNDPSVRNWANTPVPSSVRTVLETDSGNASNPPGGRSKR